MCILFLTHSLEEEQIQGSPLRSTDSPRRRDSRSRRRYLVIQGFGEGEGAFFIKIYVEFFDFGFFEFTRIKTKIFAIHVPSSFLSQKQSWFLWHFVVRKVLLFN